VNDVVLATCAGMLRAWLLERDLLPPQPLVAMVPVSVRAEEHGSSLGNQVSSMAAVLHTDEPDPRARIAKISGSMRDQKIVQAALPIHAQLEMMSYVPAAAMEQAMRLVFGTRLSERMIPFNLTISNVPGPQVPLYFLGSEVKAMYPLGPIFHGSGLNITVMSLNGKLDVGIVSCPELLPDLWDLADDFEIALNELLESVG
jgi:WS/DGAT/MGAT family acyltransferase